MKNVTIAAVLAATLAVTPLFAAENSPPLSPGKPAGVKKAQDADNNTLWWVLGGAAAAGIIAAAASGGSSYTAPAAVTTATST